MNTDNTSDHRSRVAAERRERMRARLLESALTVFADKGVGASVIQDVIAAAKVSQGTFYNYFRTNEELLLAVTEELSNELIQAIENELVVHEDPAMRIATGVRLYLHHAVTFPLFGRFVARAGLHLASPNNLMYRYLPPDLELGFSSGRFERMPHEVALDLICGQSLVAVARLTAGTAPADYPERVVETMLRALGVSKRDALKIMKSPLPPSPVPSDSLSARATARLIGMPDVR